MIVGAGQVGRYLCEKFSAEGQEVVLIDKNEQKLQRLERELNILTVLGSGASARVLAEAGISKADLFIAVTDSDEVNLVACFVSRHYSVKTRIARVRSEELLMPDSLLNDEFMGIDLIISPDWAMADEIMKLIQVSEAFDTAEFSDGQVLLLGYIVHQDHPFIGKSLFEIGGMSPDTQYVMAAIIRHGETIIPRGEDVMQAEDKIYLMILRQDMAGVESLFSFSSRLPSRIFIIGGGDIGYMVARQLEETPMEIKVVEIDQKRCEFLSENLVHSIVLNMDGLDSQALIEEGIDMADLVIAVTRSATTNILGSLLAKHHGTKRCIVKITRHDFIPMLDKLGIDVALSPRQVAADMIIRYVRRANIVSVATILDTDAEVIEVTVPDSRRFDNVALKDLGVPKGALVGAVVREGSAFIPSGDSTIKPGDNLVIFFTRDAARRVEKFFQPDA
jgi:trk system potassium uptake protein TrkA